jgi:hypothetical protein
MAIVFIGMFSPWTYKLDFVILCINYFY